MSITPQELELLMQEVEQEDPIDFADLPFEEQELRGLIANHLCEMAEAMDNFSAEDKQLTLLAVAAKLVVQTSSFGRALAAAAASLRLAS